MEGRILFVSAFFIKFYSKVFFLKAHFYSELNEFDSGLTIELWNRGILWDNLLGLYWLPIVNIKHSNVDSDEVN